MTKPPTKYDVIISSLETIERDMKDKVEKHHIVLFGNGEEGLCEMMRKNNSDHALMMNSLQALETAFTSLKNKLPSKSNTITFRWVVEKVILPFLVPSALSIAAAIYIIQRFINSLPIAP